MKITANTIFGNIGYVIDLHGVEWSLIGFDWDHMCYIAQNVHDRSFIAKLNCQSLIGSEIIRDEWKELRPYEEIRFNAEKDTANAGKITSRDLFKLAKNSK